jgi:hypothetical protein
MIGSACTQSTGRGCCPGEYQTEESSPRSDFADQITGSTEVASICRTLTTSNGSAMWPAVADWFQASLVVGVHLKPNCIITTAFLLSRAKRDGFEQRSL